MKQIIKLTMGLAVLAVAQMTYAAKPSIYALPDDGWCEAKGYGENETRRGKTKFVPNYDKAIKDTEFFHVQQALKQCFQNLGYELLDASSQAQSDDDDEMFDEAESMDLKAESSSLATSNFDELLKGLKPDILLKVRWDVNKMGSVYNVDFSLDAIDSYSNKSFATIAGQTGSVSRTTPLSVALKQGVKNNMDDLTDRMQTHFDDVCANGREVRLIVKVNDAAGIDLTNEVGGQELSEVIYNWISDNTVNHQFTRRASGKTAANYTQIRIPLKNSMGVPQDAEVWAKVLQEKLKSLGVKSEVKAQGLGVARITIG